MLPTNLKVDAKTDKSQALVLAHESSRYTNILQLTKAVVFFGTPHSGSEQASLLSLVLNIIDTVPLITKPRNDLAQLLKLNSSELESLSISFTDRTRDIEIVSFYEENAMPHFKNEVSCFFCSHPTTLKVAPGYQS
jgi:hypothetical protein